MTIAAVLVALLACATGPEVPDDQLIVLYAECLADPDHPNFDPQLPSYGPAQSAMRMAGAGIEISPQLQRIVVRSIEEELTSDVGSNPHRMAEIHSDFKRNCQGS